MEILLANPRGFCAGVDRAIEIVTRALELFSAPIYVKHEVVHNRYVVDGFKQKGVIFIEELEQVPVGSTLIYSAHGVSQAVRRAAEKRKLQVFDATCPLVTKVHMEVVRYARRKNECILIGHKGHPEVEGTLGQYNCTEAGMYLVETMEDVNALTVKKPEKLYYVTQTTLSVDETKEIVKALQQKWPLINCPKKEDICYATQNRQDAVKKLAQSCQLMLVVGSAESSNSNRLRELAEHCGTQSYLIDDASKIDKNWLNAVEQVGVTAGASAPDILVTDVIARLKELGGVVVHESTGATENIVFVLPSEFR
ncbi:MAG: 4-hydroxy-3-methylbut-2-enyl diphosphate reductase [Gammaproteobacteria bacterium]|nr:4-hydroxy-3-methylbut-2-enyl diphosphate reductase [Gammaproteobacteria bacterium]